MCLKKFYPSKIHFFQLSTLLLYWIGILNCEIALEIVRYDNGTEIPVQPVVENVAGTNLSLTCRLVDYINGTANYFQDELYWGRKRQNVQFDTVEDLENLARSNWYPLLQFRKRGKRSRAALHFHPLFPIDAGKYFCMSLKHNLFNIIEIRVSPAEKPNYSHIDFSFADLHKPLGFPKFMCTEDMFICDTGRYCFNNENVCDGMRDCDDGSDENFYLCGLDPCAGKRRCNNGRCISNSLCCDKFRDSDCMVNVKPSCCFEYEVIHLDEDDKNILQTQSTNQENEVQLVWKQDDDYPRVESLWIIIPSMIILILIVLCIMIRQSFMKPGSWIRNTRHPRCSRRAATSSNRRDISLIPGRISPGIYGYVNNVGSISRSVSPNYNPNYDLPPSYEEAMSSVRSTPS